MTPSREHLDAGDQLGERKRLGQIVIAARAQSFDTVVDMAHRGQDQDGCLITLPPQRLDHRKTVELRQHAIDDEHVETTTAGHFEAILAVIGKLDLMTRFSQAPLHEEGGLAIVFDNEHAHGDAPF
jgi:hypothetical protein